LVFPGFAVLFDWIHRSLLCTILIVCVKSLRSLSWWPFVGYHSKICLSILFVMLRVQSVFVALFSWPLTVVIITRLCLAVTGPCNKMSDLQTCISQLGSHMLRQICTTQHKLGALLWYKFFIILILSLLQKLFFLK
jgi:hypothetical protein